MEMTDFINAEFFKPGGVYKHWSCLICLIPQWKYILRLRVVYYAWIQDPSYSK